MTNSRCLRKEYEIRTATERSFPGIPLYILKNRLAFQNWIYYCMLWEFSCVIAPVLSAMHVQKGLLIQSHTLKSGWLTGPVTPIKKYLTCCIPEQSSETSVFESGLGEQHLVKSPIFTSTQLRFSALARFGPHHLHKSSSKIGLIGNEIKHIPKQQEQNPSGCSLCRGRSKHRGIWGPLGELTLWGWHSQCY